MRQKRCVFRKPRPLDAVGDAVGEQGYVGVAEMSAAGENAAEENGSVD